MNSNTISLYFKTHKPLDDKTIQYLAEKLAVSITLNSLPIDVLVINNSVYSFQTLKKSVKRDIIPDLIDKDVNDVVSNNNDIQADNNPTEHR